MKDFVIKTIGLVTILLATFQANAQIITTIAGTGTAAFSGDGGIATAADLKNPHGVAIDTAGNIYIVDQQNYRIRKINTSGVISTVAGTGSAGYSGDGGPATAAQINRVMSVLLDHSGNFYFADISLHIRKINSSGIITTIAGNGISGYSGDGGPATAAQFGEPLGLAIDASGNIYCSDDNNMRIRKITPSGIISTFAGSGGTGYGGDGGPATAALFTHPSYLYIDASNNLLVSDNGNHRIRKITPSGTITTIAGNGTPSYSGDAGQATAASIQYPGGICQDISGNIYIADYSNNRVRKINPSGIISTFAGTGMAAFGGDGGQATAAKLTLPVDVVAKPDGSLIIADFGNHRVRKIAPVNRRPHFTSATNLLSVCKDSSAKSINSLLAIVDTDAGQTETWSVTTPPMHGSLGGFSAISTSTGSTLTPAGLTYTSALGYVGADSFNVEITDGIDVDFIKIIINVRDCHLGIVEAAEQHKNGFTIVPNPSSGSFNLLFASELNEDVRVVVTDILGKKVAEFTRSTNNTVSVNLEKPAGIYIVTAFLNNAVYTAKVLIEK